MVRWVEDTRDFLRFLEATGKSERTITIYRQALEAYLRWCAEEGVDPKHVPEEEVLRFLNDAAHTYSPKWNDHIKTAVRSFYSFLVAQGVVPKNPLPTRLR